MAYCYFCGLTNVKCYIHVITSVIMIEKRKMRTSIWLPSIWISSFLVAMLFGIANFQAIAQNDATNQTASLEPLRNSINETAGSRE